MIEQLRQDLAFFSAMNTPAAIVMTPKQLMRFSREYNENGEGPFDLLNRVPIGSGWLFEGIPIWRSHIISGPAIFESQVFAGLRRMMIDDRDGTLHAALHDLSPRDELPQGFSPLVF